MNRWWGSGSSDDLKDVDRMVLAVGSSALDDLTVRQSIASEQLCQWSCAMEGNS
jgi:hypothetical protein